MATPDPSPTIFTPAEEKVSRDQRKVNTLLSQQEKYKLRKAVVDNKAKLAALKKAHPGVSTRILKGFGTVLFRTIFNRWITLGLIAAGIWKGEDLLDKMVFGEDITVAQADALLGEAEAFLLDEPSRISSFIDSCLSTPISIPSFTLPIST